MQACSTAFNAYYLDGEGRIINCYGERVFSDRVWDSEIDACYWLSFVSPEGQFGTAYIAGKTDYDRTVAVQHEPVEAELDRWLMRNGLMGSEPDAELLDAVPSGLRGAYEKRLGLEREADDEQS